MDNYFNKNQVKIIFMADTHLGFDFPVRKTQGVRPRRGTDFFNNFESVLHYAEKNRADLVIHGGDLFFRSKVPTKIVDRVYELIFSFVEKNIPMVIVPGNHERSNLPPSVFLNHPLLHIFHEPSTFQFRFSDVPVRVDGFPNVRHGIRGRFKTIVNDFMSNQASADIALLCFHQTVQGAITGPGNFVFPSGPDVISINQLPDSYDLILSGHMHRSQYLGKSPGEKTLLYAGSTERTSFAEINETKGFWELIWEKKGQSLRHVGNFFHILPARPMYKLKIPCDLKGTQVENFVLNYLNRIEENAIVRIETEIKFDFSTIKDHISSQMILQRKQWKIKRQ